MIKLNRTTEYGLIALSHIRQKSAGEVTCAREIADRFQLPFEILAKTLQKLKENNLIASTQGTKGGYILARDLKKVTLGEFVEAMEGDTSLVSCAAKVKPKAPCPYTEACNIKPALHGLNDRFQDFLGSISLEELTRLS